MVNILVHWHICKNHAFRGTRGKDLFDYENNRDYYKPLTGTHIAINFTSDKEDIDENIYYFDVTKPVNSDLKRKLTDHIISFHENLGNDPRKKVTTLNMASYDFYYRLCNSGLKNVNFEKVIDLWMTIEYSYAIRFDRPHIINRLGSVTHRRPFLEAISETKKFCALRVGIIELKVIMGYLRDKENFRNEYDSVRNLLSDHSKAIDLPAMSENYWTDIRNIKKPICSLSTNAGFYVTDKANSFDEIELWINEYLAALKNADIILPCDGCSHHHGVVNLMAGLPAQPSVTFDIFDIYKLMEDKNVLVISPFIDIILSKYEQGILPKITKRKFPSNLKLFGVKAPITIHTNSVKSCWRESFDDLKKQVDLIMQNNKIDLVIPMCGCYGLPISNYVNSKYESSTLYYGNMPHILFGILMNSTSIPGIHYEFCTPINEGVYEVKNFYEAYKKIDEGRYIRH